MPPRAAGRLALAGLLLFLAGLCLWLAAPTIDARIDAAMRLGRGDALVLPAAILSDLGGASALVPVALLAAAWLAFRNRAGRALWLVLTVASGRIVLELLKPAVGRARPDAAHQLVAVDSASFPSSHSAGSMLTAAALAVAFGASVPVRAAMLAAAAAVGLSRILLGVHWPSDVLAGWGVALFWVGAWSRLDRLLAVGTTMPADIRAR